MKVSAKESKPRAEGRMTLGAIRRYVEVRPPRVLVAGTEGVGKSTFAAGAPAPVFLGPEDGTGQLDVARFPLPETWSDVLEALRELEGDHDYKTVVLDTVDWIEPLVWAHVCDGAHVESVEDLGYGRGYVKAVDEWRRMLAQLERLRARGMTSVLLAHTQIRSFKNPEGDDYDRYELKLHLKSAGLLKEWCDAILFANYETVLQRDAKTKRVRGIDTGARLLHTTRQAAYDAKNRYDLPESLPLSWADFAAAVAKSQPADPIELEKSILAKIGELPKEHRDRAVEAIERANKEASKLFKVNNWVNAKLAEKEKSQ